MDIQHWLSASSNKPKLLVIYWPTACGKTSLTVELAWRYNGEVINADSRQIYRGMNIGTGKICPEEMQWIAHHMLDIRNITELYWVGEFAPEARKIIADIHARGKLPILSGWTGLFIDAVVGNFTIPEVKADWEYRDELEKFRTQEGNDALWEKLHAVDPLYARDLDPRNYRYVIRGLEIWKATGHSKMELGQKTESPYDFLRITPYDGDREKLYEKINERVWQMFKNWLVYEIETLINNEKLGDMPEWHSESKNWGSGINNWTPRSTTTPLDMVAILRENPGLNAIGYREILPYLAGQVSLEKTIELVQQNSRNYAKRQLTWFRKY